MTNVLTTDATQTQPTVAAGDPTTPVTDTSHYDLTTQLVAKLCHDFISPTGAIVSGLDLLDDPQAQDMREDALNLIRTSSTKLVTLVKFARIAFGAATSAESFSGREIRTLLDATFAPLRAQLDYQVADELILSKPAARALANLGYIAGNALPTGGIACLSAEVTDGRITFTSSSKGPRARLKPEALEGLAGKPLSEGLSGQWIQPFWLFSVVKEAGGTLIFDLQQDEVTITLGLPVAAAV